MYVHTNVFLNPHSNTLFTSGGDGSIFEDSKVAGHAMETEEGNEKKRKEIDETEEPEEEASKEKEEKNNTGEKEESAGGSEPPKKKRKKKISGKETFEKRRNAPIQKTGAKSVQGEAADAVREKKQQKQTNGNIFFIL